MTEKEYADKLSEALAKFEDIRDEVENLTEEFVKTKERQRSFDDIATTYGLDNKLYSLVRLAAYVEDRINWNPMIKLVSRKGYEQSRTKKARLAFGYNQ